MTNEIKINRGLKGVYFERSGVSDIDGSKGELSYRGYSIHDLAAHSSFEETAYLLIHGELPTAAQLAAFDGELKAARTLPEPIYDIIRAAKDAHPMDVLRTAVSALPAFEPNAYKTDEAAMIENGVRLTSQAPIIVAAHEHIRHGREPVAARSAARARGKLALYVEG